MLAAYCSDTIGSVYYRTEQAEIILVYKSCLYITGEGPPRLLRLSLIVNNFLKLALDFSRFFRYTLRIESERRMRTREEVQEEQRKAEARVQRWNESVRQVRELARQWQRDNAHLGPFLHPVEDEES